MMKRLFIMIIRIYRTAVSPFTGRSCRFHPSCSLYAETAVEKYGILKGGLKAAARILRCHPFADGGYDPLK